MKTQSHFARSSTVAVVLLGPLAAGAGEWWWEAGPAFRGGMQIRVEGSSYVQTLGRHAAPAPLSEPASVGATNQWADRIYDDGYVKLDAGTLNPESVGGPGNTWNFAYDRMAQFNAAAGSLTYSRVGDVGYVTTLNRPVNADERTWAPGVQLLAGYSFKECGRWRFDLGVGLQGVWGAASDVQMSSYQELTGRLTVMDRYNVADAVDPVLGFPLPQTAPGGYVGNYDTPGTTITNVPAARTSTRQDLSSAQNAIRIHVDADLYEITLRPRARYAVNDYCTVHVSPTLGFAYLDVSADRSEVFTETVIGGGTTTLATWKDHGSEAGFRFTAGLTAGAEVALGHGFHAGVFGGYQWVVNEVKLGLGPNVVAMDGGSFVGGAIIGKSF